MKKLKFLITLSLFLSLSFSFAQSKVAHIDTQKLISEMPEIRENLHYRNRKHL